MPIYTSQPEEVHIFGGKEEEAKEYECVLIYNEVDKVRHLSLIDTLALNYLIRCLL